MSRSNGLNREKVPVDAISCGKEFQTPTNKKCVKTKIYSSFNRELRTSLKAMSGVRLYSEIEQNLKDHF